jgi:tetratricopeptide (TPR) repeat protein
MRFTSAFALGLMVTTAGAVTTLLPAPALAAKKDEAQIKPTPAFIKVYVEIDKLAKANDFAGAKGRLAEAEQAASTPDDHYLVGLLTLNTGIGLKDETLQRNGLEKMLGTGKVNATEAPKLRFFAGQFALKAKDYDKAIAYFTEASAGNYGGSDPEIMLAESYFGKAYTNVSGNQLTPAGNALARQGLPHLKKAIDTQTAAGKPVPGEWYSRGFRMAAISGAPDLPQWTAQALKMDPNPDNWRIALRSYQDAHREMTREENLDLLRLMASTGALKDAYSYGEYVDASMKGGLVGEAKSVIDRGRAAGALSPTQLADAYKIASAGIAKDKASLPAAAADAAKAANGRTAAVTGNAYLSYGDYAKAAELYRLALKKGGVDADEVNTRLAIALANSGDVAGAKTALALVAKPGNRKAIADFWTVWLSSRPA